VIGAGGPAYPATSYPSGAAPRARSILAGLIETARGSVDEAGVGSDGRPHPVHSSTSTQTVISHTSW